jgi:hypothetical protein
MAEKFHIFPLPLKSEEKMGEHLKNNCKDFSKAKTQVTSS